MAEYSLEWTWINAFPVSDSSSRARLPCFLITEDRSYAA